MKSRIIQNNLFFRESRTMKPISILSLFAVILLSSCGITRSVSTSYDDVYYSPNDPVIAVKEVVVTQAPAQQQIIKSDEIQEQAVADDTSYYTDQDYNNHYTESDSYTDPNGNTIINNYYGDYYDYSYAARIRRFHQPYGFNSYYHDYYTNMYWYNYDPFYWGTSIYTGFNWYPSYSFYYGWGMPRRTYWSIWYDPYFMYGFGYPHYYYGWNSYSYWSGYNRGYWDGYLGYPYYGSGGWYSNSYDQNSSYYYGPRTSFASNTGSGSSGRTGRPGSGGGIEKVQEEINTPRGSVTTDRTSRPDGSIEASRQGRPVTDTQRSDGRSSVQESGTITSRDVSTGRETQRPGSSETQKPSYERPVSERSSTNQTGRSVEPNQRTYQYIRESGRETQTYQRPSTQSPQREQIQREPQPYTSPRYTKPKSSEEFTNPAYRNPRGITRPTESTSPQRQEDLQTPSRSEQQQNTPGREVQRQPQQQTNPGRVIQRQQQQSPGRQPSAQPRYEAPQRQGENRQTTPPRSMQSQPSRSSTPGYSAPSRSSSTPPSSSRGSSYSAPSRSSGSSSHSSGSSGSSSSGSSRSSGRGGR